MKAANLERLRDLVENFPAIAEKGLVAFKERKDRIDFDALAFRKLAGDPWLGHGDQLAANFVLSVWDPKNNDFNIHEALGTWDDEHRSVFVEWAEDPFWC